MSLDPLFASSKFLEIRVEEIRGRKRNWMSLDSGWRDSKGRRNGMNLRIGIQIEMGWIHGSGYFTHSVWPNPFNRTKKLKKCHISISFSD